jgi:hypothetical protein
MMYSQNADFTGLRGRSARYFVAAQRKQEYRKTLACGALRMCITVLSSIARKNRAISDKILFIEK